VNFSVIYRALFCRPAIRQRPDWRRYFATGPQCQRDLAR